MNDAVAARPRETPLIVIKGSATDEETAALLATLASLGAPAPPTRPIPSEWAAPSRRVNPPMYPRPGGWRASALPR